MPYYFSFYKYILILFVISGCKSDSADIQLLLDLPLNSEYVIVHEMETSGTLISLKLYKEISFVVTSFENNVYQLKADLRKVTSETFMNGETDVYSSTMPKENMSAAVKKTHSLYTPMLSNTFTISVDKYGNIVKPFAYKNRRSAPEGFFDFNLFQIIYPFKKISTKSKWESQRQNPVSPKPIHVKYEVKHIAGDNIYISASHIIPSVQELLNSNTLYGDYIIDKTTGILKEATLKMKLQTGGTVTNSYRLKG